MKQIRDVLCSFMMFFSMCISASADEYANNIYFSNDKSVLIYNSDITDGSIERVKKLYSVHKFSIISLSSNGGEYDAGMDLAKFAFTHNLKVYVPHYCASACTFTFFGVSAFNRDIAPDALIGLHNISFSVIGADGSKVKITADEAMEFAQNAVIRSGTMLSLYAANGIPADVLYKVSRSYGDKIVNVQRSDLIKWGSIRKK